MDYSPFFGMNILVAKPILPLFYVGSSIFVLLFFWYLVFALILLCNINIRGGKDA